MNKQEKQPYLSFLAIFSRFEGKARGVERTLNFHLLAFHPFSSSSFLPPLPLSPFKKQQRSPPLLFPNWTKIFGPRKSPISHKPLFSFLSAPTPAESISAGIFQTTPPQLEG